MPLGPTRGRAPGAVPSSHFSEAPRTLEIPSSLSKPEPGAGNIRELILVPTGDSLGTEPSPDRQEMTPQPSSVTPKRLGVSPQSCLQPS